MISTVKAELDEMQDDMDSTISFGDQQETYDEGFASQETRQHGRHSKQHSDKVEANAEEIDKESGLNHCERIGTVVCEGEEGVRSSLQISAEDIEQLQRAKRTEIDFDSHNLHETLRVVLRNTKAKKFHTDSERREMECDIAGNLEMNKTDSNSTLQEHRLQDNCRLSERQFKQSSLEKDQGEGNKTLYQDLQYEDIGGPVVGENSEWAKFLSHKSAESSYQTSYERRAYLENSSSQETSVQVTDDCGNEKEDSNNHEPQESTYSTKASLSTHENESNQGMEVSGADIDDTSHSGLCSENDEEENQPDSTESDVTVSGDELPVSDSSNHETSAGANEDESDCQTSIWRLQKSCVNNLTTGQRPDFLLTCETGTEQSHSTLTVRVPGNRKKSLKSLEVRSAQQPQQSKTSESEPSESSITEGEETSVNRSRYKCTVCETTFRRRVSLMNHRKTHVVPEMQRCRTCNRLVSPKETLFKRDTTRHDYFQCQFCESKSVRPSENWSRLRSCRSGKMFRCHFCKKKFSSMRCLIIHKITHNVKNQFLCQFCGKIFTGKQSLHVHERIHHNDIPFECQFCGKMFVQKMQMILHERKHQMVKRPLKPHCSQKNIVTKPVPLKKRVDTVGRPFQCHFCVKRFISKDHAVRHERSHFGERRFQCKFCAKRFISKSHVSQHERIHTGERPFKCQFCAKAFVQKTHCTQHERIHTGEKPYKCQFCEKRFLSKAHATIHERRIHAVESPFKCQLCSNICTTKSQLTQHKRIHTDERKFKHSFYNQTSQSNSQRITHERIHTREKPFQCSLCPKRYTQKSHMTFHEKLHTNERPFKCSFCEKRFVLKYHVEGHEKTHTGEREFKCHFCVKRFITKSQAKQHEKTHTAERKFKCSFCNKAFQLKSSRTIHERIHTNERPYECSFCAQRFIQQSHVICHERIHTNEKPFKCSFCEASFIQKCSLNYHEKVHIRQMAIKTKA
ncbi:hypothetical protein HOLleu_01166 [Holothuria leucospilota]|uniref:C2H2-type domain-containing protein n=1 Tax=Holothuria leucospilota TaxID=206669 RepID=A0A9Q1HJ33_HOLLE|nr:hypothetical protein HOLleu_01166 [Holothuria leucospilota]